MKSRRETPRESVTCEGCQARPATAYIDNSNLETPAILEMVVCGACALAAQKLGLNVALLPEGRKKTCVTR